MYRYFYSIRILEAEYGRIISVNLGVALFNMFILFMVEMFVLLFPGSIGTYSC